jgi:diacylglycerol kinase family enzyme
VTSHRPLVVLNPASSGGRTGAAADDFRRAIEAALGPCDVELTRGVGDGRRLGSDAVRDARPLVVAVGGDGTISEVADGLLAARNGHAPDEGPALGIVPAGTGSDLARSLGLPLDARAAAARLAGPDTRRIDAGRARLTGHDGGTSVRHFVNTAAFGLPGFIASAATGAMKHRFARFAYLAALVRGASRCPNVRVVLSADGSELAPRSLLLCALGNGATSGGGLNQCPGALVDDGLLRLALVDAIGPVRRWLNLPGAMLGPAFTRGLLHLSDVRRLDAAPTAAHDVIPIEIDGECPGRLPATFEVLPGALVVRG